MPIKGLTEKRRLPRIGKIKLGIMLEKKKGNKTVSYPKEVDYFVCPEVVRKTYGEEPKELLIMFPVEDEEIFFPQWYNCYQGGVLSCKGDGETAKRWDWDKKEMIEVKCPCERLEQKKCRAVGRLQFLLPEVKDAAGVFQIDTGSKNSIQDINSGIDFIRGIVGRIAMVPIRLRREPIETTKLDSKEGVIKGTHFTMKFSLEGVSLSELAAHSKKLPSSYFLPPADEEKPDDLFPDDGYEEDAEPAEKEPQGPDPIIINLSSGEKKEFNRKEATKYLESIEAVLGKADFETVLEEEGYKKVSHIADEDFDRVYQALVKRHRKIGREKNESPPDGEQGTLI